MRVHSQALSHCLRPSWPRTYAIVAYRLSPRGSSTVCLLTHPHTLRSSHLPLSHLRLRIYVIYYCASTCSSLAKAANLKGSAGSSVSAVPRSWGSSPAVTLLILFADNSRQGHRSQAHVY